MECVMFIEIYGKYWLENSTVCHWILNKKKMHAIVQHTQHDWYSASKQSTLIISFLLSFPWDNSAFVSNCIL
jgi:hypothetical protein